VYRGDDLYFFANQAWFASGRARARLASGNAGQLASMWILAIDGSPFALRIAGGT
jgi:hypothetical protein